MAKRKQQPAADLATFTVRVTNRRNGSVVDVEVQAVRELAARTEVFAKACKLWPGAVRDVECATIKCDKPLLGAAA